MTQEKAEPENRDPAVVFLEGAFWGVAGIAMISGVTFVVTFFLTCWWMPSWGYFVATSMVVAVATFFWIAASEKLHARFNKPLAYAAGAILAAAAVASLVIPPPTSSTPDVGEDEAVVYTDADCGGLLGFARRDDITSVEKADALDEYSANC